jgi:hypothetical protein
LFRHPRLTACRESKQPPQGFLNWPLRKTDMTAACDFDTWAAEVARELVNFGMPLLDAKHIPYDEEDWFRRACILLSQRRDSGVDSTTGSRQTNDPGKDFTIVVRKRGASDVA